MVDAYKLLRLRKNGTLGPLFIDRKLVFLPNKWHKAKAVHTKGFAFRPGFHACIKPYAPHLTTNGRVWCKVRLKGIKKYERPECQGGTWFTAKHLKIVEVCG